MEEIKAKDKPIQLIKKEQQQKKDAAQRASNVSEINDVFKCTVDTDTSTIVIIFTT